MENKPFENSIDNKINEYRESLKKNLENIFDDKEIKLIPSIDSFIIRAEVLEKNGIVFNKEEIINGLKESINIQDRETFVSHLLKVLEPILISKINQADVYEKIEREVSELSRKETMSEPGITILSEFLYCTLEKDAARIHLATAYDFIKKEKILDFKQDIINGFKKLAKVIEPMKNINKIVASSWIVEKSPRRLKELGFTIEGEISKEEKEEHFRDADRKIFKAYIDRKKFDEIYLDK